MLARISLPSAVCLFALAGNCFVRATEAPKHPAVAISRPASFSVGAVGKDLAYLWLKDGRPFQNSSASHATLTIDSVQLSDAGVYQAVISNAAGSVTTEPATLSVIAQTDIVAELPVSQTVNPGDAVEFHLTATGDGLTYRWQFGDVALETTTSSLNILHASLQDTGSYRVTVSNRKGIIAIGVTTLKVVAPKSP